MESLELLILSHENESGTFSKGGDSRSLIVSALGEFVDLLTGGTNKGTNGSDITFATLFEWVWELVLKEFSVPTCISTTLRPSWPTWLRFVSFLPSYPIMPVNNDLYVKEFPHVPRPWFSCDSFPLLFTPTLTISL
jgi:hypothetical protein